MKKISLTQGKFAWVDDEDFEWLNQWKWCILSGRGKLYAARHITKAGKRKVILMHRVILGLCDSKIYCDHINGFGLDNCRKNLRPCNHFQNMRNRKGERGTSSRFKGVCWHKPSGKWQANIVHLGRKLHLGLFRFQAQAARIYNFSAKKYFGEFAFLNKI